jgi:hypothetical protein
MRSVYEVRDGVVQHVGIETIDADGWYISEGDDEPLGWGPFPTIISALIFAKYAGLGTTFDGGFQFANPT